MNVLTKNIENRGQVEFVSLEQMVPADHLLRQIDAAIDFHKIYEFVGDLYCKDNGRPSIDPVVLFRIVLIQHIYGIRSLRRTLEEISMNTEAIFVDGTHIKASASLKKQARKAVPKEAKRYAHELFEEINKDRESHGKQPFDDDNKEDAAEPATVEKTVSATDPECGVFHKGNVHTKRQV